jgi:hypothetical protein
MNWKLRKQLDDVRRRRATINEARQMKLVKRGPSIYRDRQPGVGCAA